MSVAICPVTKSTSQVRDADVGCFSYSWRAPRGGMRSALNDISLPGQKAPERECRYINVGRCSSEFLLDRWQSCLLMAGIPRCPGGERRISPCGAHRHNQIAILVVFYAEYLRPVWKRRQQEAAALRRRNFSFSSRVCQRP